MVDSSIDPTRSISIALNQIRKEAILTDLLFVCHQNGQSVVSLPAHQILFSALSTTLKCLFEIANQKQPYEQIMITLDNVDSRIMEKLIEFIYIGNTKANITEQLELIELCSLLKLDIPYSKLDCKATVSLKRQSMATIEEIPCRNLDSSCYNNNDESDLQIDVKHQTDFNEYNASTPLIKSSASITEVIRVADSLNTNLNSYTDKRVSIILRWYNQIMNSM